MYIFDTWTRGDGVRGEKSDKMDEADMSDAALEAFQ